MLTVFQSSAVEQWGWEEVKVEYKSFCEAESKPVLTKLNLALY